MVVKIRGYIVIIEKKIGNYYNGLYRGYIGFNI